MTIRAFIDVPSKLIFEANALSRLGLELASMGARSVGVVVGRRTKGLIKGVLESLEAAKRRLTGVFECECLDLAGVDNALRALGGSDVVVSVGGWLQTSLSMYACGELQAHHVVIATPPSLSVSMARAPVPLKGCLPPLKRFKRPSLIFIDPYSVSTVDRGEVAAEVAALCAKTIVLMRINYFAGVLAWCALNEFKRAITYEDFARLCFSAAISGLANGLLNCSATWALAKAMHALYSVDPFLAELALLPSWLAKVLREVRAAECESEIVSELAWLQGFFQNLSLPSLRQLGLKAKNLDLVVEYAWTFEHDIIEPDPVASDKYALRELLGEAMRR